MITNILQTKGILETTYPNFVIYLEEENVEDIKLNYLNKQFSIIKNIYKSSKRKNNIALFKPTWPVSKFSPTSTDTKP